MTESSELSVASAYISSDKCKGYLNIGLNFDECDNLQGQIKEALLNNNIVYGVNQELIDTVCCEKKKCYTLTYS